MEETKTQGYIAPKHIVTQLLREYPKLDHLMAETLVYAHEKNLLEEQNNKDERRREE